MTYDPVFMYVYIRQLLLTCLSELGPNLNQSFQPTSQGYWEEKEKEGSFCVVQAQGLLEENTKRVGRLCRQCKYDGGTEEGEGT